MSINATLIGQMITFALLVWFTMKYVWPPLIQALETRKQRIEEGLAAAEKGRHDLELSEKRATVLLREAKDQAAEIISLAQKRANEIIDESKVDAKTQGDRIIAAAKAEIDKEVQLARIELRQQVSGLAFSVAEKILKSDVDRAKHAELIADIEKELR